MWDFLKAIQKMQELAEELEKVSIVGVSADGYVRVTISGYQLLSAVEIDPSILGQKEAIERGIVEAFQDARNKLQQFVMDKLGGTPPPFLPGNIGLG